MGRGVTTFLSKIVASLQPTLLQRFSPDRKVVEIPDSFKLQRIINDQNTESES